MLKGLVNMTNKLFNCGCKTDFTIILDEVSGLAWCLIVTKLRRDVCKNLVSCNSLSENVSHSDDVISVQMLVNDSTSICRSIGMQKYCFATISVFNMELIPHQTKHPVSLCVSTQVG